MYVIEKMLYNYLLFCVDISEREVVYLSVGVVHVRRMGIVFLNNSLYSFLDMILFVLLVLFNAFWY